MEDVKFHYNKDTRPMNNLLTDDFCQSSMIVKGGALSDVYKGLRRYELLDKKDIGDATELCGIYYSDVLNTNNSVLSYDINQTDTNKKNAIFQLPKDDGIFINDVPFHHLALTPLNNSHVQRLLNNGIEISTGKFSPSEDKQIFNNWKEFSEKYGIPYEEGAIYVSAAVTSECSSEHRIRLKFLKRTNFRPWMCKRLLHRTCSQVFRRCYFLFRNDRLWTSQDDNELMELYKKYNNSWEKISHKLNRTRFACHSRYHEITNESYKQNWSNIEIARLYLYLCQQLKVHPVLVATVSEHRHLENEIIWNVKLIKLKFKTIEQCKQQWSDIKKKICFAKEVLHTDVIKAVEKFVFPNSLLINSIGSVVTKERCILNITATNLADCINLLLKEHEDCRLFSLRHLKKDVSNKLGKVISIPFEIENAVVRIVSRISFILQICKAYKFFHVIPGELDSLKVRLEILAFMFRETNSYKIKKHKVRKYIRRYLKLKKWPSRKLFFYSDKRI